MKKKLMYKLTISFIVLGLILTVFNQIQLASIGSGKGIATGIKTVNAEIIPIGTPKIYGSELGIKYDDVGASNPRLADETISIMGNLDRTINLEGDDLDRYIAIVSQISCEYCCGAKSIIFGREETETMNAKVAAAVVSGDITEAEAKKYRREPGAAACGCAHSYAMRGVAKYLISEHGSEFSDDEILTELAKWKVLYFPGQMVAKAEVMKEQGIKVDYISLGSNQYRDIEKGSSSSGSGMVGGC